MIAADLRASAARSRRCVTLSPTASMAMMPTSPMRAATGLPASAAHAAATHVGGAGAECRDGNDGSLCMQRGRSLAPSLRCPIAMRAIIASLVLVRYRFTLDPESRSAAAVAVRLVVASALHVPNLFISPPKQRAAEALPGSLVVSAARLALAAVRPRNRYRPSSTAPEAIKATMADTDMHAHATRAFATVPQESTTCALVSRRDRRAHARRRAYSGQQALRAKCTMSSPPICQQ